MEILKIFFYFSLIWVSWGSEVSIVNSIGLNLENQPQQEVAQDHNKLFLCHEKLNTFSIGNVPSTNDILCYHNFIFPIKLADRQLFTYLMEKDGLLRVEYPRQKPGPYFDYKGNIAGKDYKPFKVGGIQYHFSVGNDVNLGDTSQVNCPRQHWPPVETTAKTIFASALDIQNVKNSLKFFIENMASDFHRQLSSEGSKNDSESYDNLREVFCRCSKVEGFKPSLEKLRPDILDVERHKPQSTPFRQEQIKHELRIATVGCIYS